MPHLTRKAVIEARRSLEDLPEPRLPLAVIPAGLVRAIEKKTGYRVRIGDVLTDAIGRKYEVADILEAPTMH